MDRRLQENKTRYDEEKIKSEEGLKDFEDENDQFIIKTDKVQTSATFMESMIYSLVHKLDCIDDLNTQYYQNLGDVETYPKFLKYYIHIPCNKTFPL